MKRYVVTFIFEILILLGLAAISIIAIMKGGVP